MKTNVLLFPCSAIANGSRNTFGRAIRALLMVLGIATGLHGAAIACNLQPVSPTLASQFASYTFEASRNVATPFPASAVVQVFPSFEGLEGCEAAKMDAFIANGGSTLYAVITDVSTSTLPGDVVLGSITVIEGGNQWNFVVRTEGLGINLDEEI